MKTYMLFGFRGNDLEKTREAVEAALGIRMDLHESDYCCGEYYRFGDAGAEHFVLQKNFDDVEGEWTEPEFPSYDFLLYVNETEREPEIREAMTSVAELLSSQEA
jgi:hypothetical protein